MGLKLQTAVEILFPPRCVGCGALVDGDFGLCGPCWRDTPLIAGLTCSACGVPLPGAGGEGEVQCDECIAVPRPWVAGRAALLYRDRGRKLVLALKHGHRHEVVQPAAAWMQNAARQILRDDMLVAPVPLHWSRLFRRTFNQSAVLAAALSRRTGLAYCPDLLLRPTRTQPLDRKPVADRIAALEGAIAANPRRRHRLEGRRILLVDDVMTSGATLAEATRACLAAGSGEVFVLTLARVAKDA